MGEDYVEEERGGILERIEFLEKLIESNKNLLEKFADKIFCILKDEESNLAEPAVAEDLTSGSEMYKKLIVLIEKENYLSRYINRLIDKVDL